MYVVYKNVNDNYEVHIGELLTSLEKLRTSVYCDVIPKGHIVTEELDWKQLHIQSVDMGDVMAIAESREAIENNLPEYFI